MLLIQMLLSTAFLNKNSGTPAAVSLYERSCDSDIDCSLNGVCSRHNRTCICDKPWTGARCGVLGYATTPAVAKDLFPINRSHNTWNGPVIGPDAAGQFHAYVPLYGNFSGIKSLFRVEVMLHGVAESITGPYTWTRAPDLPRGINPAALAFPDPETGRTLYTLWTGGILPSWGPAGPWNVSLGHGCGGNNAPAFYNGTFFCVSQHTTELMSASRLGDQWSKTSDINVTLANGSNVRYADVMPAVEDPFLWVDRRGSFHIINHRYNNAEESNCGRSTVSAHVFSPDGIRWHVLEPSVEPYGHTVRFDDGSSHTFPTLERPNIHFDANGMMTHINFAAQLAGGDDGCNEEISGKTPGRSCAECKFYEHCGTVMVTLLH